jgi:UDP-N-acetyl-D-mannosaminuronic acid dehydrogenase
LRDRLASGDARLAVIGLGFVGTPVAALFAASGLDVLGVDIDPAKVAAVNAGTVPFEGEEPGLADLIATQVSAGRLRATSDYDDLAGTDAIILAVETPVEAGDHKPRYAALRGALTALGPQLHRGVLVIVESTLAPGTMRNVVAPTLELASGLTVGADADLLLVHCPERVMPGRLLANLRQMSRAVGGVTPVAAQVARALYTRIVEAELDETDALTAELVKTGENAYRDVQIAFANEMALICNALGADVWAVRELLNKSPGRNMLLPGAGVGGHCIPKDPWLLVANAAASEDFEPRLIPAARAVNDHMPAHVERLIEEGLREEGRTLDEAIVLVLGASYLEDSEDERNAPSATLTELLEGRVAQVRIHDPWVERYRGVEVAALAEGADAIAIMVAHSAYQELDWGALREAVRTPVLVDGRRVVDADVARAAGWRVRSVGVGARPELARGSAQLALDARG